MCGISVYTQQSVILALNLKEFLDKEKKIKSRKSIHDECMLLVELFVILILTVYFHRSWMYLGYNIVVSIAGFNVDSLSLNYLNSWSDAV